MEKLKPTARFLLLPLLFQLAAVWSAEPFPGRDSTLLFNTWMVGFYPAHSPDVAFAVLISVPGGGPIKAGHLTRYAFETYLWLKKAREGRS